MTTLSFITLTWNSAEYITSCINSIVRKCDEEDISFEIIIVDNGSQDETVKAIENIQKTHGNRIALIPLEKNLGTTYPRNLGIKKASGEFISIIDSDTELKSGSLSSIIGSLSNDNQIGIIAPKLILPNGSIQHSVKKFPTFFNKLLKIPKAVFKIQFADRDFYSSFPFRNFTEVDSAISACWFFKKTLIDQVGLLDEKIFYSPEDLDFCIRVRKSNKKIFYYPFFEIMHHTQQISHKSPFSKVSLSHFWGLLYYFKKHGGWFYVKI